MSRRAWLAAGLLVLLAAAPGAGQERAPAEDAGLTATTGFAGRQAPGGWVPVEVAVHPARLVSGTLVVETSGPAGRVRDQRQIEVAAGSRKVYRFVVPSGPVTVRLVEGRSEDAVSVRARAAPLGNEFLAGVMGAVPANPAPLRHEPTGMGGAWVGVDPAWLELSHRSLDSLGFLVAEPDTLAGLSPQGWANLLAAVAAGLDLVVPAGPGGAPPDALPWDVRPVPAAPAWPELGIGELGVAEAGRGRVTTVPADAATALADRELWTALAGPRPGLSGHADWALERNPWEFPRLLTDPGGAAPALPWLSVFILAYVLVVGPVNGLVLARLRRRELAWVTVPLVTAVFTAGAFLGAVGGSPAAGTTARVLTWVDGAGIETVVAAARAPRAGDHRLTVDGEGWTLQPVLPGGRPATVTAGPREAAASFSLGALETGGLVAARGSDVPAPLAVEAVDTPDGMEVTVRNAGSTTVRGVSVHAATASRRVGDLEPGETGAATIASEALPGAEVHFRPHHAAGPPRSLEALLASDLRDGNPGLVWAVGETDGRWAGDLVAVAVRPGGERLGPLTVARAPLSGRDDLYRPGPLAVDGPGPLFLRFRFPAGSAPPALASQLDRGPQFGDPELAVWDHAAGAWEPLASAFPDGRGDPGRLLGPLGELWVRASGELFPFDFSARTVFGADA